MDGHKTRREVLKLKLKWCCESMMFGTKRKKKGENPEPSSPKVTCIGQVRVKKSKKQGKRLRSRSKRRGGGDVSFRQEQRWVQLPVTICRAFGADRNCLLPCRPQKEKSGSTSTTCCGALFTRWDRKERDIEVTEESCRSRRRHVFEDVDIEAEGFQVCAPPKNALLLMRCRSDPLKVAALANRFYQHNNVKHQKPQQHLVVNNPQTETDLLSKQADDSLPTQFLDIEDTTESESESQDINSEQQSEVEVEAEVREEELREEETVLQEQEESTEEGESQELPECLMMMMMYEPKLSMEVSKETWVCTTDFIRCLPDRPPVIKTDVQDEPKKRISMDAGTAQPPPVQQAARSSCSYPPPTLSKAVALTRCKSEPKRSAPDACSSWKIQPHPPGIAAAVEADH